MKLETSYAVTIALTNTALFIRDDLWDQLNDQMYYRLFYKMLMVQLGEQLDLDIMANYDKSP
jgi:hypothetical protein